MTAIDTPAQNPPNSLDVAVGGTIQIHGQPSETGPTDTHTFMLEGWTELDIRLEAAVDTIVDIHSCLQFI